MIGTGKIVWKKEKHGIYIGAMSGENICFSIRPSRIDGDFILMDARKKIRTDRFGTVNTAMEEAERRVK